MKTGPALITPEVARWARKRAEVSYEKIAEQIPTKPDAVESWESGTARPTLRQAEKLARILRIPFGYLFLSEPPVETVPLPDFRMSRGKLHERKLSLDLRDTLSDVLVKHDWYRAYLKEEEVEPVALVGRFSMEDAPHEVARYIRGLLDFDDLIPGNKSAEDLLRALIRKTETLGIAVMVNGVVKNNNNRPLSPSEFRGFAISDPVAPLVFINGKDAKAAQMFTLAHELAHVAIGATGISNEYLGEAQVQNRHEVEIFCNAVAAETLVPSSDFLGEWDDHASIQVNLSYLIRRYRVSSLVILKRALDLGKITRRTFDPLFAAEERRGKERSVPGDGGDFRFTLPLRNSKRLTSAVVGAALDGSLPMREAARLLGVGIGTLAKIPEWLKTEE